MRKKKIFSTPDMCLLQFDSSIKFLRFKICCKIYPTIHKTPKVAQYQSKTHLTILRLEHGGIWYYIGFANSKYVNFYMPTCIYIVKPCPKKNLMMMMKMMLNLCTTKRFDQYQRKNKSPSCWHLERSLERSPWQGIKNRQWNFNVLLKEGTRLAL